MQTFEIMKRGKWTASGGQTLDFSEDMLKQAVDAYDPELHEAPIVIGHPKDNGPAYGWIKSLNYSEGVLTAEPVQVDAEFAEMVAAGRFKKRSASFYLPDSPANPKPGTLYLRHVGFLGAQPPAVKGLKDVNFSDNEEGVVEFADSWAIASLFRRLREWMIGKHGIETADSVLPSYQVESLEAEARRPMENPAPAASFNEAEAISWLEKAIALHEKHMNGTAPTTGADGKKSQQKMMDHMRAALAALTGKTDPVDMSENSMTPEQIAALQAKADQLEQENAALKAAAAKHADFAERETSLAAREAAIARAEIETRVDAAIKDGRVLPAQKKMIVDFAVGLADAEKTIDFGEGDKAEKVTQRELYLRQMEQGPKLVDFKEHSGREPGAKGEDDFDIGEAQRQIANQVATGGKAQAKA